MQQSVAQSQPLVSSPDMVQKKTESQLLYNDAFAVYIRSNPCSTRAGISSIAQQIHQDVQSYPSSISGAIGGACEEQVSCVVKCSGTFTQMNELLLQTQERRQSDAVTESTEDGSKLCCDWEVSRVVAVAMLRFHGVKLATRMRRDQAVQLLYKLYAVRKIQHAFRIATSVDFRCIIDESPLRHPYVSIRVGKWLFARMNVRAYQKYVTQNGFYMNPITCRSLSNSQIRHVKNAFRVYKLRVPRNNPPKTTVTQEMIESLTQIAIGQMQSISAQTEPCENAVSTLEHTVYAIHRCNSRTGWLIYNMAIKLLGSKYSSLHQRLHSNLRA